MFSLIYSKVETLFMLFMSAFSQAFLQGKAVSMSSSQNISYYFPKIQQKKRFSLSFSLNLRVKANVFLCPKR